VVPAVRGKKDCSRTFRYEPERGADPLLKNVAGQQVTLTMFGQGPRGTLEGLFCKIPGIAVQLIP
jgi:hypothetical protein